MTFQSLHAWDVTPQEAIAIQESLWQRVIRQDQHGVIQRVAGIDIGFEENGALTRAAVVVLSFPGLEYIESAVARRATSFPYIPGLLSFREAPAALEALEQLKSLPDLLICDGQGIAHPRRFGLASHLGLLCDLPSIGAAKSRLIGEHAPLDAARGEWQYLFDKGEIVGAALRTRQNTRPVYVSIGHRVSLESAIRYTLDCARRFRLPEPTRQAHQLASINKVLNS
jgi:deoxyribonuclease V